MKQRDSFFFSTENDTSGILCFFFGLKKNGLNRNTSLSRQINVNRVNRVNCRKGSMLGKKIWT